MKNLSRTPLSARFHLTGLVCILFFCLICSWSCKTPQPVVPPAPAPVENVAETTPVPQPKPTQPEYPYRPSATRAFDLLHTRLEVDFDWEKEQMHGEARLEVTPWFYPRDSVVFDAHGMLIHRVALFDGGELRDLKYNYDQVRLAIDLGRAYARQETLQVFIDYTARPEMLDSILPPEAPRDKGLYFINPRNETPDKPQQIWTQGESHGSPAWFPTFDQPNERCTQEIYITVPARFTTLSNGLLVNSSEGPDSTRTDYWRMTLPHPPYLFAMAIGEFAVVRDEWRGREVSYYVDKEYEQYARMIFGKTPQMMEFFSNKLGVEYPWEKYGQVVVQDFVSGAMENTTATIHMGALQHDARRHLDNTYEDYVSHELFHQWFGDLVTCESWANLTLNEGFATYGEVLWREHAYGLSDGLRHHLSDRQSYLFEARRRQLPLIHYRHKNADAMFNSHSYQKGGQVIHMLRKVVGDEAFFASLREYLSRNAYTDVEVHELRLAFEEVTGEDLNWFFDQWFLSPGHPVLEIERQTSGNTYQLRVQQVQDMEKCPVFRFPLECEIVRGASRRMVTVWVETADTTFNIDLGGPADCVIVDADNALLAVVKEDNNSAREWVAQLRAGRHYGQQSAAMNALSAFPFEGNVLDATLATLKDGYFGTRGKATQQLLSYSGPRLEEAVRAVLPLLGDGEASVRNEAVSFFYSREETIRANASLETTSDLVSRLKECTGDSSYSVQNSALRTLYLYDSTAAVTISKEYMDSTPANLVSTISEILRQEDDPGYLDFITLQYRSQSETNGRVGALRGLDEFIKSHSGTPKTRALELVKEALSTDKDFYPRYFALRMALMEFVDEPGMRELLTDRAENEPVEMLRRMIKKELGD